MKEFPFFLLLFCCCYCYSIAFLVSHMRSLTEWKLLSILDAQVPYMTLFSLNACLGLKWYSEPWFNFLPMSEIGSSCTLFAQWVNKVGKSRSEKEISSEKKKKEPFKYILQYLSCRAALLHLWCLAFVQEQGCLPIRNMLTLWFLLINMPSLLRRGDRIFTSEDTHCSVWYAAINHVQWSICKDTVSV